jgi:hypothetical protein
MKWKAMVALSLAGAASLAGGLAYGLSPGAGQTNLETRATVLFVSRELPPAIVLPPPSDGYCLPSSSQAIPYPPNTIFGLLTIGGQPAPAGTIVQLQFDGQLGPAAATAAAGGYRIDYAAGGAGHTPPCINQVGAAIAVLVNGVSVDTGTEVGSSNGAPSVRFDVAIS